MWQLTEVSFRVENTHPAHRHAEVAAAEPPSLSRSDKGAVDLPVFGAVFFPYRPVRLTLEYSASASVTSH